LWAKEKVNLEDRGSTIMAVMTIALKTTTLKGGPDHLLQRVALNFKRQQKRPKSETETLADSKDRLAN